MSDISVLEQTLNNRNWKLVCSNLLANMLSEFMYEEIISPIEIETNYQTSIFDLPIDKNLSYQFKGKRRLFDSYKVLPDSIKRIRNGTTTYACDPFQFILDTYNLVGITEKTVSGLIKELSNTALADMHIVAKTKELDFDKILSQPFYLESQVEGHPRIIFNKGRLGFDYNDYLAYAPEQKQKQRIFWVALNSQKAETFTVDNTDYNNFVFGEITESKLDSFILELKKQVTNYKGYYLLPVHEWQWYNHIIPLFAADIYNRDIVPLGFSSDYYLPQQSIRTLTNITKIYKKHIKLPLTILNTSLYRGIPRFQTFIAPLVTNWLKNIQSNDPFLKEKCRLILLGEVASAYYKNSYFSQLDKVPYQYNEMLGCIWRESIFSKLSANETPIPMSMLAQRSISNINYISILISRSGLNPKDWIKMLFKTMLPPILHYLYKYGIIFTPHGQNVILVVDDYVPSRIAIKDFADDTAIVNFQLPELGSLPSDLDIFLPRRSPDHLCRHLLSDLCLSQFWYLFELLESYYDYSEHFFWYQMRQEILRYQYCFPELNERFRMFDLLKSKFFKLCLNRKRLFNYGYEDYSERPHTFTYGQVNNALNEVAEHHSK